MGFVEWSEFGHELAELPPALAIFHAFHAFLKGSDGNMAVFLQAFANGTMNADHLAAQVKERSARIPSAHRAVCPVVGLVVFFPEAASAYRRDAVHKITTGMPHGHTPVALLNGGLVRHFSGDIFARRGDLRQGCVTIAIASQRLGFDLAAIGQRHRKFRAAPLSKLG